MKHKKVNKGGRPLTSQEREDFDNGNMSMATFQNILNSGAVGLNGIPVAPAMGLPPVPPAPALVIPGPPVVPAAPAPVVPRALVVPAAPAPVAPRAPAQVYAPPAPLANRYMRDRIDQLSSENRRIQDELANERTLRRNREYDLDSYNRYYRWGMGLIPDYYTYIQKKRLEDVLRRIIQYSLTNYPTRSRYEVEEDIRKALDDTDMYAIQSPKQKATKPRKKSKSKPKKSKSKSKSKSRKTSKVKK